jgi:hypothetical protein
MRSKSRYYKLVVAGISGRAMQYLNLEITIENGRYLFKPWTKPTALLRPLGDDSSHHPSIHVRWPVSVVRSLYGLSSNIQDAMAAHALVVKRFIDYDAPQPMCDRVARAYCSLYDSHREIRLPTPLNENNLWLVLPFHPVWHQALQKAITEFFADADNAIMLTTALGSNALTRAPIRISWKNLIPAIANVISRNSGGR